MRHVELNNKITEKDESGFYKLHHDKEAIDAFYYEEVLPKMKNFEGGVIGRIKWLVDNNYYYPEVLRQYSEEQIKELSDEVFLYGFEFQSYMAISKFYLDYALKSNEKAEDKRKYLEFYEDRVVIVSLYLARGDFEQARRYAEIIGKQLYQPATPTFLNSGKARRGELVSCFLTEVGDDLNGIGFAINKAMQLSKIGGGVALNLSKIRATSDPIKEIEGASSGIVPVMKLLEDAFSYANQLGQRKGAGATYLNIFHMDIIRMLDTKRINVDEKSRIQSMSIGVIVPDKFMQLVIENKPFYTFSPYDVEKYFGVALDDIDMDLMYDILVKDDRVRKYQPKNNSGEVMTGRDMLTRIAITQQESGYPYLMYKGNANGDNHPLSEIGEVKMSNLCTEIFQLSEVSTITDYGEEDIIRNDISCNLGSLNIVNVMEDKRLRMIIHNAMYALTAVSDMSVIQNAPGVKKANEELHSVGLGAMNLHGYLSKNLIAYESEEAKDFARTFFMMLNYYSIEASAEIALRKGETFKGFEKSDYASGKYFDKYLVNDFSPKTEKVKKLFEGIEIPGKAEWLALSNTVKLTGMYNGYRLAIAPTQSIGYVQNATQSVMPITHKIEPRTYQNAETYFPAPYLSKQNFLMYKPAYDMSMYKLIDLIAEIQPHVDQGISTILYVNSDIATNELAMYYLYAYKKGLKSLYYTRTRKLSVEECEVCAV
ncbi:ribonucleotide reductase large subunit [Bacillus phage BCD7]|uniref:Ribonucleoside-diphosphate reductase n=1 Tax=Bacillus phage BCD7 TaxID=1136534 RepID=J9PUC8_9CAUD|nr:ribonucleotide reductase large subunit [Bacillus phage BCD7]AEZ50487.1 ribonucleotide-diphosphate reductase subunit alpha [Bacillus phage BCD7]